MAFVVVYDANVLYPSTLRDVLVHVALTRLVQAKWTERILVLQPQPVAEGEPALVVAFLGSGLVASAPV